MPVENKLKKIEIVLLAILLFTLPSMETPKTVFWALYIIVFMIRRFREHGLSFNKQNLITLSAVALFLVSLFSTWINWPIIKGLSGAFYTLSYVSLFLCLYHGGYSSKQIRTVVYFVIFGTVATLLFGIYEFSSGQTGALQLHSVGATTHSSIYLGIALMAAVGLLLDDSGRSPTSLSQVIFSIYVMGTGLLYMGSRGAIFAMAICVIVILLLNHSRRILLLFSGLAIVVTVTAFVLINAYPTNMNKPEKRERFSIERIAKSDSERLENWKIAIGKLSTGKDLVWGIGPHNYQSIDPRTLGIDSSFYKRTGELSHAHNLFLTQMVEQGIIGLTAMLLFFFLVLRRLKDSWAYCKATNRQWIWSAGLGAITIPVIAGLFNTPFYREHAMLAMILIGAMYSETEKLSSGH